MPCFKFCRYIDKNIMPLADFLHSPTSFPLTKQATKSYFGIFLSFIMILIFSWLTYVEYTTITENYSIGYSQEFISRKEWNGRNITIGFNVSEDYTEEINFALEDSEGIPVNLEKCDENLNVINDIDEMRKNYTYYCIKNYPLKINVLSDYALRLNVSLINNNFEPRKKIPFSLAIREPIIQHDNVHNPLDINNPTIDKYRCTYDTIDITTFRRNLNSIIYKSTGGFIPKKDLEGIYLDDHEDSRKKVRTEDDGKLIGTYRIMVSKKIDVYSREYIDIKDFLSKIGGYIGFLMTSFSILCKILVNPNDDYRIFDYLKKKKSIHLDVDSKSIYDDLKIENKLNFNDFNMTLMDNRWFSKTCYKFSYFFCRFFSCCKRVRPISMVSRYIQENLTIENYLESQILYKKLLEKQNRIDELKARHLNIIQNQRNTVIIDDFLDISQMNQNKDRLLSNEGVEMISYNKNRRNTVFIEKENDSNSFTEKQQEDIIKIVLRELF